jgi:hypothetical protein
MKQLRLPGLISVLAAALLFALSSRGPAVAQLHGQPAAKWEYKLVHRESEDEFNTLGAEEWELCGVAGGNNTTSRSVFVFKRPAR